MDVYLATLADEAVDNWELSKKFKIWGVRERTRQRAKTGTNQARRVRAGDVMYVWRGKNNGRPEGNGVIARAVIAGRFVGRTQGADIPWPDPHAYLGSFPITDIEELATPVHDDFANHVGVESGIENIFLNHGFRKIIVPQTIQRLEGAFAR